MATINKLESGNRLSEVTSILLFYCYLKSVLNDFVSREAIFWNLNSIVCILLIQSDISSLISQIKDLQKKNTELDEENKKMALKVKKIQIVICRFIFLGQRKTKA